MFRESRRSGGIVSWGMSRSRSSRTGDDGRGGEDGGGEDDGMVEDAEVIDENLRFWRTELILSKAFSNSAHC